MPKSKEEGDGEETGLGAAQMRRPLTLRLTSSEPYWANFVPAISDWGVGTLCFANVNVVNESPSDRATTTGQADRIRSEGD